VVPLALRSDNVVRRTHSHGSRDRGPAMAVSRRTNVGGWTGLAVAASCARPREREIERANTQGVSRYANDVVRGLIRCFGNDDDWCSARSAKRKYRTERVSSILRLLPRSIRKGRWTRCEVAQLPPIRFDQAFRSKQRCFSRLTRPRGYRRQNRKIGPWHAGYARVG
jgi:hypothetical protein